MEFWLGVLVGWAIGFVIGAFVIWGFFTSHEELRMRIQYKRGYSDGINAAGARLKGEPWPANRG